MEALNVLMQNCDVEEELSDLDTEDEEQDVQVENEEVEDDDTEETEETEEDIVIESDSEEEQEEYDEFTDDDTDNDETDNDETKQPEQKTRANKRKRDSDLWIKQVRKYQASTNLLIPRASFRRLSYEIIQDYFPEIRFTKDALEAIQVASEDLLIDYFQTAQRIAIHANRDTIMPKDMKLVQIISESFQWRS